MPERNEHTPENCPYRSDHDLIIRIDERTENMVEVLSNPETGILKHLQTLNGRTGKNEKDIGKVMAVAATLSVLIPILVKVLWP